MLGATILISAAILTGASMAAAEPVGLYAGDPASMRSNVRPEDDLTLGEFQLDFVVGSPDFVGIVTRGPNGSLDFALQLERLSAPAETAATGSGWSDSGWRHWVGPEAIIHYTLDPHLVRDVLVMARSIQLNRQPRSAGSAAAEE